MKLPPGHIAGQGVVQATAYGGYGERLLRTMGWGDGQGLGLDGTGIKEAIQVKKKDDTVGIGSKSTWNWEEKWWEKAFDSAVQTVKTADSDSSSSSDSDSDDDDNTNHHHAAGKVNRDGTMSSASVDELRLLKHLSKRGSSRMAAGRFGGRGAKLERIRAQEADMAAQAAAKLQGKHHQLKSSSAATNTTDNNTPDSEEKHKKHKKKKKNSNKNKKSDDDDDDDDDQQSAENNNKKKQRIVIEPVIKNSIMRQAAFDAFIQTPSSGWWGANMFKSVGCLEGLKDQKKQKRGFNEDDQTRIFNAAHAGKTQGKVGLGQGTGTVKVAGVKWEGNKVTFSDDNNGGGGGKKKQKKEKKKKSNSNDTEVDSLNSIKWKKLIKQALQTAPDGRLKLKQLQKNMMVHLEKKNITSSDDVEEFNKVKAMVVETIERNSKNFVLIGKNIQLMSSL